MISDIPLQLIIFSIPSLFYLAARTRLGDPWKTVFQKIGWVSSRPIYYLYSLVATILTGSLGWLAFLSISPEILQDPNLNISAYSDLTFSLTSLLIVLVQEAIYVALGEEIFFRGLLGGWLIRRYGFRTGNLIQALIFLLPHFLLLLVSLDLWPILIVQFLAGWLLGWLRDRSKSILPGWLAHSLINTLGAFAAM
jgi:uncharacterized protein